MHVTTASHEATPCLRCGSVNIHAEKRGWNLATGLLRSGDIMLTCLKCGYRFRPGQQRPNPIAIITLVLVGLLAFLWLISNVNVAHAESTTQRDAPTTNFYDARGNKTGSASTYGNTTNFYDSRGNKVGTATNNGGRK